VKERLVNASEPFATQRLCLDYLKGFGAYFLVIICQLPPDFAALVEKARQVKVILQLAFDFRYIGYTDNTASFRNFCRWRQPSITTEFTHGYRSVLN
jgi:hypothetical protein